MFKPSANSTWILAYVWRSRLQQREKHGHRKDIGQLVQSGGQILVLSTGSRKNVHQHLQWQCTWLQTGHIPTQCAVCQPWQCLAKCCDLQVWSLYFCFKNRISNPNCWSNINDHAACISCFQTLHHQPGMFWQKVSACTLIVSQSCMCCCFIVTLQYTRQWAPISTFVNLGWKTGWRWQRYCIGQDDELNSKNLSLLFEHSVVCELWVSRVPRYWWEAIDWKDSWCESIITHPMADNCRLRSPATYRSSWQLVEVHVEY